MQKKGAIQLSITTIIVIVIGITLLTLGIVWIRGMMGRLSGLTESSFEQAEKMVRESMPEGEKLWISGVSFDVDLGKQKEIYLGIRNILGETQTFKIEIKSDTGDPNWVLCPKEKVVEAGDIGGVPMIIKIKNAPAGETYFFTINVYDEGGNLYGSEIISITTK